MPTFTSGAVTITPTLVLSTSYEPTNSLGTVKHRLLSGAPAYSLRAAAELVWRPELYFSSDATAVAARAALLIPKVWTYTDAEQTFMGRNFVVIGDVRMRLDPETFCWVLTVDFSEVPA